MSNNDKSKIGRKDKVNTRTSLFENIYKMYYFYVYYVLRY